MLKVALVFLSLSVFSVPSFACFDDGGLICQSDTRNDALRDSVDFYRAAQKLYNVVSNNNQLRQHEEHTRDLRNQAARLSRTIAVDSELTVAEEFQKLRTIWVRLRHRLNVHTRYPDLRLHLRLTQERYEQLNRTVNLLTL